MAVARSDTMVSALRCRAQVAQGIFQQKVHIATDKGQRGAQFMRNRLHKLVLSRSSC